MPVVIFDMDGVLYRGSSVMPHARETLERLRRAGWQVFFATNNSTSTREEYVQQLRTLRLGGDVEHIVTSGYATAHYLERLDPKPRDVYVLGANGLREEIRATGISVRDASLVPGLEPPDAVVADGVDPGAMRRYLTSVSLPSPADTVVVGLDLHLTYAKRKPEPFLFEEVLRRAHERDAIVVGDSTDYDMVAAHRVGARGVLILTGLTEGPAVQHARGDAMPDRVIKSLDQLFTLPEFAGL